MGKKKKKNVRYNPGNDFDSTPDYYDADEYNDYVAELKAGEDDPLLAEEDDSNRKRKSRFWGKKSKSDERVSENDGASDLQEEVRKRASKRLMSLDALRGLNMLCILGLATLITCVCKLSIEDFRVFGDGAVVMATSLRENWIGPSPETIVKHMEHVQWNGVLHHDTIFPLFLFLAGVSFPFSFRKQRANGRPMWRVILKILWRGLALVFLGIIYSNKVNFDFAHLRYMGVLQHIGLAWMFAAFIYLLLANHKKTLISVCAFMLLGYWFVVALVPAPDVAPPEAFTRDAFVARAKEMFKIQKPYAVDASSEVSADVADASATRSFDFVPICENNKLPDFDAPDYPKIGSVEHNYLPEGCVVNYIDRKLVPGRLYHQPREWNGAEFKRSEVQEYDPALFRDLRDPEGLASTWPAIVTALLGMLFGGVLCREDKSCSQLSKFAILVLGGVVLLAIGFLWHLFFPINKNLWNSSFVCFVGGYSALVLALFYLVIDIGRQRWLAFPFAVVGMNSITVFLAKRIIVFTSTRDFFFADAIKRFVPTSRTILQDGVETVFETSAFSEIATVVAGLIVTWCFVYWLYRHKIFFRV